MFDHIMNPPFENLKVVNEAATRISALADIVIILNGSTISHSNAYTRQLCATVFNKNEHLCECHHDCRLREKIMQGCYDEIEHLKRHATKTIGFLFEDLEKYKYFIDNDKCASMKATLEFSLKVRRPYKHIVTHVRN